MRQAAGGLLVVALVTGCGLDVRGLEGSTPSTEPTDGGVADGSTKDADAAGAVDATANCPVRCNGACVTTCSSCASRTSECDGVCVASCSDDCKPKPFRCVGCTEASEPRPICAATRNACPVGADACTCTSVTTCPTGEHVCAGGRCLTCSSSTGNDLDCQNGKRCKSDDAKCD